MQTFARFYVIALIALGTCHLEAAETVHVVMLAGQSNMAGAGNYDELSENDKLRVQTVTPRILLSSNGEKATTLSYRTIKGEPMPGRGQHSFGPEMFLGVTLAEANPGRHYLFIKYAVGGTSLHGAWNPQWSAEKSAAVEKTERKQKLRLVAAHQQSIQQNLDELDRQGKTWKIFGMAWMQGENDAARKVSAVAYEANLQKLIATYRDRFNVPNMPFVCGQINSHYGEFSEGPNIVRAAFESVARSDPFVSLIRTKADAPYTDFPKIEGVHYNAEGQKRLGVAMAEALSQLQSH